MVGNEIDVVMIDGPTHRAPITIGVMCTWEDQHPGLNWQQWAKDSTWKPLAFMGWAALQQSGVVVRPFNEWLKTVAEVRIVGKERTSQDTTTG